MNQITHPLFIGYATLEEWLTAIDNARPVFANLVVEPGNTGLYDTRIDKLTIIAGQPDHDLVHYCRLAIEQVSMLGNKPFDNDHEQRHARARQAWEIVSDWMDDQGLKVKNGVIAVPDSLRLLDGWADFLVFDQEQQKYIVRS